MLQNFDPVRYLVVKLAIAEARAEQAEATARKLAAEVADLSKKEQADDGRD